MLDNYESNLGLEYLKVQSMFAT